jgi:WD40 repeat protein
MAFSPDGSRLAFRPPLSSAPLELFNALTGDLVAATKAPVAVDRGQPRWAPDGKRLLLAPLLTPSIWTGSAGTRFFSMDGASGEVVAEMKAEPHEHLLLMPQWSPASDLVVAPVWTSRRKTTGPDAEPAVRLAVWDPVSGRRLGTLGGGLNNVAWDMAWSPDGSTIAAAGQDRAVRLWDVASLRGGAGADAVAAVGVSRTLLDHAGDAGPDGPSPETSIAYPRYGFATRAPDPVRAAAWRPDGRLVATALRAPRPGDAAQRLYGRVHLWDPDTAQTLAVLDAPALALDWTADGGRLVALGPADDGRDLRVTVWDVAGGDTIRAVEVGRFDVARGAAEPLGARLVVRFSPDGKRLALVVRGVASTWDVAGGRRELELPPTDVRLAEWSPDGARLLVLREGPESSSVEVRDAASGDVMRTLRPRLGRFRSAVWTPDGRRVVTASTEKRVSVWDPDNGGNGTELLAMPGDASALGWTRDGRTLLGSGPALQRWDGGGYETSP